MAQNKETVVQVGAGSDGNGGIVFNGKSGTVYGNVTLQDDLEIKSGESLTVGKDASLTVPDGKTLTNKGTVTTEEGGTLTGNITNAPPKINTTTPLPDGTVGTVYNQQLAAENTPTQWSVTNGTLPDGLTLNSAGTITGTPSAVGSSTFTVTATNNGSGSDSKEFTLTINPAPILVTGVKLNTETLELFTGNTATLTATVEPDNATNQNVTWSSSDPSVATVANGVVTAVGAGTATITATAADGSGKTAACTVTVERPYVPPANPNYRIDVTTTEGGTVDKDPAAAKAGTTVTLTPVPHRGYQVGSVAVTDRFGDAVAVTEQADGTYTFTMPNGQVTVTVTFAETPLPFTDVTEGDWFYDAVRYAYETGLMDGVGDSLFAPNSETTRAQLVTILYRLEGEPEVSGTSGFTDVEADIWYTDAVAWAAQNGIVNGVSDTEFAPGDDITREQLAAILYRYAACQGYDVSQRADLSGFGDASSISGYAQEALSWAHAQGLVLGFEDGSLRPQGTASRAQIAAVLMRFLAAVPTA
ncbi:S-layer homology domain-containing protein [Evtepia sp.]|uniref:S-layer homology domain-containing protein n=1 Tax=Evtepia sp. TaxID=2773933 RepID=UPI002E7A46D5|nr:S-layer homology domain-containing protein [Evtepia sp.]MEE0749172.1 S-layer homology domain-containing protein [Evtepia sp.]